MKKILLVLSLSIVLAGGVSMVAAKQQIQELLEVKGLIVNKNIQVGGKIYRGDSQGPGDDKAVIINDSLTVKGDLIVDGESQFMSAMQCNDGEVLKYSSGEWLCAADIDTDTDTDTDTLASLDCDLDEAPGFNGSYWSCYDFLTDGGIGSEELTVRLSSTGSAYKADSTGSAEAYIELDTLAPSATPTMTCDSSSMGAMIVQPYTTYKLYVCTAGGWKSTTLE